MKSTYVLAAVGFLASATLVFAGTHFTAAPASPGTVNPPAKLVSPAASDAVDTDDLIGKLTGANDVGGADAKTPAARLREVTARMGQSSDRLGREDAGDQTQEVQGRIVSALDAIIEQLMERPPSPRSSSAKPPTGPAVPGQAGPVAASSTPASSSAPHEGNPIVPPTLSQSLAELRSQQINLPDRDRGAILNGATHGCLKEYQEMVRRYYEALAELGKSRRDR